MTAEPSQRRIIQALKQVYPSVYRELINDFAPKPLRYKFSLINALHKVTDNRALFYGCVCLLFSKYPTANDYLHRGTLQGIVEATGQQIANASIYAGQARKRLEYDEAFKQKCETVISKIDLKKYSENNKSLQE